VRLSRSEDALGFAATAALDEGFGSELKVVEGLGVFFAGESAALEIEEFFDEEVDDVLDSASVDAHFIGRAVLKDDVYVRSLDASVAPIHASEGFHVFAHLDLQLF
jgi:hypothetical protein